MSVAFIPEIANSFLRLRVTLNGVVTDVSDKVRFEPPISYWIGRNDESSTLNPAKLTFTLDNTLGAYTKRSLPRGGAVTLYIDPGTGTFVELFTGDLTSITPAWQAGGRIPIVNIAAAGVWRQILQRKGAIGSALYRFHTLSAITTTAHVLPDDYWPLEDAAGSTVATPVTTSSPGYFVPTDTGGGVLAGKVNFGADTDFIAADRAMSIEPLSEMVFPASSDLYSPDATHHVAVSFSIKVTADSGAFVNWYVGTGANAYIISLVFFNDGSVDVDRTKVGDVGSTTLTSFNLGNPYEWDGVWRTVVLSLQTSGGVTNVYVNVDDVQKANTNFNGAATTWFLKPQALHVIVPAADGPTSISHLAMWKHWSTSSFETYYFDAAIAWAGENVGIRVNRLIEESAGFSPSTPSPAATVSPMGPQRSLTLSQLILECAETDQGILYDGRTAYPGSSGSKLIYICGQLRENPGAFTAALSLDAGDLTFIEPTADDQRTLNRVNTKTVLGASFVSEQTDGELGTDEVGVYEGSVDVNPYVTGFGQSIGDWLVHLGTIEGFRYPEVGINLRATPSAAIALLALLPSKRLDITNLFSVFIGLEDDDVALIAEGWTMTISPKQWTVVIKCSPQEGWAVGTLAAETGDTGLDSIRLSSGTSFVSTAAIQGATSLLVQRAANDNLWTTAADDYPLYLDVGGMRVRATACSGAGATQTFTVDALPEAVALNTTVDVWDPPVLGL